MPMKNKGCNCCGGASGNPLTVGIPGCFCQGTPQQLNITVSFGQGETSATYGGAYINGTLRYYTSPDRPSYLSASAYGGSAYYSTAAWKDSSGALTYYKLSCYSSQYALSVGQYSGGIWQAPGRIYLWAMGGNPAVNSCRPFGLYVGNTQPGVTFNGKFVIS